MNKKQPDNTCETCRHWIFAERYNCRSCLFEYTDHVCKYNKNLENLHESAYLNIENGKNKDSKIIGKCEYCDNDKRLITNEALKYKAIFCPGCGRRFGTVE